VNYKDESFVFGQIKPQSTIGLNVSKNINVLEFKQSFKTEFGSEQQFRIFINENIVRNFNLILKCPNVLIDSSSAPQFSAPIEETNTIDLFGKKKSSVEISINDKNVNDIKNYLKSKKEEFYLFIKEIDISNKISGNGSINGGGTSESCQVSISGELWNVKTSKILISYTSVGEGSVFLAFNKTALNQAIHEAIVNFLTYLKTGSIYSSGLHSDSTDSHQ
jgi:hypothetical protein